MTVLIKSYDPTKWDDDDYEDATVAEEHRYLREKVGDAAIWEALNREGYFGEWSPEEMLAVAKELWGYDEPWALFSRAQAYEWYFDNCERASSFKEAA